MATTRTIWLPKPLPHQRPILISPARFKAAACGRRWGKTAVGLLSVLRGHGPERGSWKGAIDGGTIWWIAPTYGVAAKIWRDLKRSCRDGWKVKSETEHRIELPGGGSVAVKSAELPDNLRGDGLDGVVLDEAAFIDPKVWNEALRPSLSDTGGWAMFLSTPNGRNWFYEVVERGMRSGNECGMRSAECGMRSSDDARLGNEGWHGLVDEPTTPSSQALASPSSSIPHSAIRIPHLADASTLAGWQSWRLPTAQNPLISAAELAEAKRQIGPRAFAQEYEAQFLDREGAEFSGDYFKGDIWFDRWPDARDVRLRVMALDPSKGKGDRSDYSAFVMLAVDAAGLMWVEADLERRDVRRIIDDGMALARRFRPDAFGVEANQFQEVLYNIFQERSSELNFHLPLHAIHNFLNKESRIRATLTTHLARRDFRFHRGSPGTEKLVDQLKTFPGGEYDDGPDALEMAVRLVRKIAAGEEERVEERVTA